MRSGADAVAADLERVGRGVARGVAAEIIADEKDLQALGRIAGDFIETKDVSLVAGALNNALLEELQLEDRINDEVRLILDQYQDEMSRAGASYQEMFKKVKGELVRKYKAVL